MTTCAATQSRELSIMSSVGISSVDCSTTAIKRLLAKARELKPNGGVEPALTAPEFDGGIEEIGKQSEGSNKDYAAIETACRNIFYALLASTSIDEPPFGEVWNLLDIISILSDSEICEPSLLFWLVEELLDTQTIDGCRILFDYLDSRRERITAKHFKAKSLIILRACNELLRRLSRAEDTVFCGRVFIFLFQSFPLGDRSSVNLRGEYHVENVTVFEGLSPKAGLKLEDGMEVDQQVKSPESQQDSVKHEAADEHIKAALEQRAKSVKSDAQEEKAQEEKAQERPADMDTLYPLFWSLQESFSTPTRLFDDTNLQDFQRGLSSTLIKFKEVQQDLQVRGTSKLHDDGRRGVKRKRNGHEEISDLAFRRHVLVQALILVDFLLSLTPKAKRKLEHTSNKSVLYTYALNEDNAKWATNMRSEIATYLQQGPEGKFYYRMVDTVLSRDKNWVHWKAEGCPPIQRIPISAGDFSEAEKGAEKACANKRLRATPMGSLDLKFLSDSGDTDIMEKLKDPERYQIPTAESFRGPIVEDDFDIEMAKTSEEKQQATDARASKLWRTLRIASKSKLNVFDKIDDGNNLEALFRPEEEEHKEKMDAEGTEQPSDQPAKDSESHLNGTEQKPADENGVEAASEAVAK
ncbi:THO complex, subunit THOC1 [Usnea florida]